MTGACVVGAVSRDSIKKGVGSTDHLLMLRGSGRGGRAEPSIFEAKVARWMWFRTMLEGFEVVAALGMVRRRIATAGDRSEYIE